MAMRGRAKGSKERAVVRVPDTLKLRIAGNSFRKIGETLGISHVQAFRDVQKALRLNLDAGKVETEELRELESQRIDELWETLYPMILEEDGSLNFDVLDRLLRLSERRAKLLGLDKPVKQLVGVDWTREANLLGVDEQEAKRFVAALADEVVARSAGSDVSGSSKDGA